MKEIEDLIESVSRLNSLEKKEKLKEDFAKRKQLCNEEGIKSFSDLDIQIDEDTIEWYEKNR